MNRRDSLRILVSGGSAMFAGCSGIGDLGRQLGIAEDSSDTRKYRELSRKAAKDHLTIQRHSLGTNSSGIPRVEGVLKNTGPGTAAHVEILAVFYNAQGDQIDTGRDLPINIASGNTYTFRVYPDQLINIDPIEDYDISFGSIYYVVPT